MARKFVQECHPGEHLTLLMDKNRVCSMGHSNRRKTHPLARRFGHRFCTVHSELAAVIKAGLEVQGMTCVNIRLTPGGRLGLSKPCSACQKMLSFFGVDEVWFSTNNGEFSIL